MVPVHYKDREDQPTIRARDSCLQRVHPFTFAVKPRPSACASGEPSALGVVLPVIGVSTVAAVRELAPLGVMEFRLGLEFMATSARVHARLLGFRVERTR